LIIGILFYSFRALLRFTLTSRYINELYWFTKGDFNKLTHKYKKKLLWFQEER